MDITIQELLRTESRTDGEKLILELGSRTRVVIDTSPEHRDIRIEDRQDAYHVQLADDYTVADITTLGRE